MDREYKGTLFKLIMTISFLSGVIAFFFSLMYTDRILCKAGFGVLMFFSLLCTFGVNAADMSMTQYIRTSTKVAAALFPLSVNGGALAAAAFLVKEMDTAGLITVIAASAVAVISSSVLVRRYMEDDF